MSQQIGISTVTASETTPREVGPAGLPLLRRHCLNSRSERYRPNDAWTLRTPATDLSAAGVIDTSVRFLQPIPTRLTRLLPTGGEVPSSDVRRLVATGHLTSSRRLTGRTPDDFTSTQRRHRRPPPGRWPRPPSSWWIRRLTRRR